LGANLVNGWREVLARIFNGLEANLGVVPDWLINPDTGRRLKLDYLYPQVGVAVRFVGLEGSARKRRKSDEEVADEAAREEARAAVCREHGVILITINPDGEPREALRGLEMGLARAASQLALSPAPHDYKQKYMPLLSQARRVTGEFSGKLTTPEKLNLYAEMWWDRQAALLAAAPSAKPSAPARKYKVGMDVEHVRFGPGRVTAIVRDGNDTQVTVLFIEAGERTFAASLVGDKLLPA
jgi:hypothetical protein